MKLRRTTAALAAATTLGLAATAVSGPAEASPRGEDSLAAVLQADGNRLDGNWRDFDLVDRAVSTVLDAKPDSPVSVLADGSVELTAFLPTDAAFRRLVGQLTGQKPATEQRTFAQVAKAFDADTIEAVLLYHVVPGASVTYRQAEQADGAALETALQDGTLDVRVDDQVILGDADMDGRDARVQPRLKNLNAGNRQIAHGITQVLRPVDLP